MQDFLYFETAAESKDPATPEVDMILETYPQSFHPLKKPKYDDDERRSTNMKHVRPAYEPPTKAPNQAMYSGGYRPNVHENVQYPTPSSRSDLWQQNTDKPLAYHPSKNLDSRLEKFDIPRGSEHLRMGEVDPKRSRSGTRDSRSPIRRDRSPIKDRYRRHSPSPRSPRRSWALEKRRSPDIRDAPPPPIWPGPSRECEYPRQNRSNYSDIPGKIDKTHVPTWERPSYETKNNEHAHGKGSDASRRPSSYNNPIHVEKWKPIPQSSSKEPLSSNFIDDRFPNNSRDNYSSKEHFERPSETERMPYKRNFREYPMKKDDHEELRHKKEIQLRRDEFLPRGDNDRREVFRASPVTLNKEIDDVYKRVAELGKKAQEYRKKESRFDDRDDQFYNENDKSVNRGRDDRREFVDRFDSTEETSSRRSDETDRPARQRDTRWGTTDVVWRPRKPLNYAVKSKRDKAAEELTRRLMNRYNSEISDSNKDRIREELGLVFTRIFYDMFSDEDVSYIEIIVKYNKKYDANDEAKIFEEVMSSFSNNYRKRSAADQPDVPVKTAKTSPGSLMKDIPKEVEFQSAPSRVAPNWNTGLISSVNLPVNPLHSSAVAPSAASPLTMQMPYILNPGPVMVPEPSLLPRYAAPHQPGSIAQESGYNLYLCKDDFQPFDEHQADALKSYLVSQIIEESEKSQGWAPDFIMKGLHTLYRYEIVTQDERSKDWLLNLDFSDFYPFNVLVYTGEELWYERAAIWLPGHSRCRHIEPLRKLKLQNRMLEGVNIGKWKFVRKVVTAKGTRIYVDMPPSSARALDNHKMTLSYELQKVSVFLKAMAVDKAAFDAGLNEASVEVVPSMQISPMPSLTQDVNVVKIGLKGNKHTSLVNTRKIKDMVVYRLFQYLIEGGKSRTDFLKYGFCSPGYLGIIPENPESRRWLIGLNIGTLNRQCIVVLGGDDSHFKYIKMYVFLPSEHTMTNGTTACEKLKQSNQCVKGINFSAWKNAKLSDRHEGKTKLEVFMDLESVETIIKLNYELDFVDEGLDCLSVIVKSDYSHSKLQDVIKQYKDEMIDTYDVANMDIASDSNDDNDDDVVCLD